MVHVNVVLTISPAASVAVTVTVYRPSRTSDEAVALVVPDTAPVAGSKVRPPGNPVMT